MPSKPRPPSADVPAEYAPTTLRGYYETHTPLRLLFRPAGLTPADSRDPRDTSALLFDLRVLDPDLRKTVKLAVGRVNLPRWLQAWLKMIVESEMGDSLNPSEVSRGFGLRRLFSRCRENLAAKDAAARRRAYNLLRLSLVCVHSVQGLDPVGVVEEATRFSIPEGGSRFRGRDLERNAVTPLLRATSPATLKKAVLSLRFWMEWSQSARADVYAAKEKIRSLTHEKTKKEQDVAAAREEIRVLKSQAADSARRIASLSRELDAERNRRVHGMHEAKGHVQHFFDTGLVPRLQGAREALDREPVAIEAALERLDRTLELLEEERPWLSSD